MIRRSPSLSAYLALAARGGRAAAQTPPPRPQGTLVWLHVSDPQFTLAATQLHGRLRQQRPELEVLITGPEDDFVDLHPPPLEQSADCVAFLNHWRPDLCLWIGGDLRPALITLTADAGIPMVLIDPPNLRMSCTNRFWQSALTSGVLSRFAAIVVADEATADALVRKGAPEEVLSVQGPFQDGASLLPVHEPTRNELATLLRGRSVWLAVGIREPELDTIIRAHRALVQFALRSVLILAPDPALDPALVHQRVRSAGFRVARWSEGDMPSEITQVILGEAPEDIGLWYRLAPVCFLGGSLVPGMAGSDPNVPAAHGSAILSGPNVAAYEHSYERYEAAEAVRFAKDDYELGILLRTMVTPSRAAAMARAAWDVSSRGAMVVDHITDLSHDLLDAVGAE